MLKDLHRFKSSSPRTLAVFILKTNYSSRRTIRLDEEFVSDEDFDCINAKTEKSVGILFRRIVRQYKYEKDSIFRGLFQTEK